MFISNWKTFLQTDYAKKHVPDWRGKLKDIQSIGDNEQTQNYVESEQQREEWMVLADFIQSANSNNFDALSENDWHSCSYPYTPQQLLQMSAWINSTKQHYKTQHPNFNIDISTFSSMQLLAYSIVKDHFENPNPQSPLHLLINGFAGTGKSYLINALTKSSAQQLYCNSNYWKSLIQCKWCNHSFTSELTCWP